MNPILEQVPVGRENSIWAFQYAGVAFDAPWHFHPQHELTYIESSQGTKFIGDFVGSFVPGELVLLQANLPHCWKNEVRNGTQAISTVIQWERGILGQAPEMDPVRALLRKAAKGLIFSRETTVQIKQAVLSLPNLQGMELYFQLIQVLGKLSTGPYQFLSESSYRDGLSTEYSSRMARIHDFVAANYHRKIQLRELADLVNLSEQSFSRFFSKMMGRPFFTFLNEYRINVAGRMLLDTDWTVAEIGFASGYESLPFFHKQFAKFKQNSPARYRKRYQST